MLNRRDFLKSFAAAGLYCAAPGCLTFCANSKVRLAVIGIGGQGEFDLRQFAKLANLCEVVALCDTDLGAEPTLPALALYPKLPAFHDFRQMFDLMADKIDAVLIATPDHSHFCAAVHALRLGKSVYIEKPLAHSFEECELLMYWAREAAKKGAVTQMGNQGHGGSNLNQYKTYVETGVLANITKVVSHMNMERRWHRWGGKVRGYPAVGVMPSTLDWSSWISSAPFHPYSPDLVRGEWRCWYDYGNGCLGDWGAHIIDMIHQYSLQSALPTRVEISNVTGWNPYVFPVQATVHFRFPATAQHGAIDLEWWEGLHNQPKPPEGFRFDSNVGLFPASTANDGLVDPKLKPGKEIYLADGTIWQGLSHASTLSRVGSAEALPDYEQAPHNHYENFLRAVRGEEETTSPFAVAAPLSQMLCLGVIAQRLNRSLDFDPTTRTIRGDAEATALLKSPPRRPEWDDYYHV